jgi:hypothetical protein
MTQRKLDFEAPRLRSGVEVEWQGGVAVLKYREQGCELDIPTELHQEARILLSLLAKGVNAQEVLRLAPSLTEQLPDFLTELDRLGLLVETAIRVPSRTVTGVEFYRRIRRFGARISDQCARSVFYHALRSGAVSRDQLVGYVLEYYQLVLHAPRIIAPVLAHTDTRRTYEILSDFLTSELGHDRMIMDSLNAVGIREEHLKYVTPLPSTFALISGLGVLAAQDHLSFKCVLFVFEEADDRFSTAFQQRCRELRMPIEFSIPVLQHAAVNDEYSHGDITRELLEEVPVVSEEEQVVALKHLSVLIESLVNMEDEILNYYGRVGALPHTA